MDDYDHEEILTYFNNFDSNKNGVLEFSDICRINQKSWVKYG